MLEVVRRAIFGLAFVMGCGGDDRSSQGEASEAGETGASGQSTTRGADSGDGTGAPEDSGSTSGMATVTSADDAESTMSDSDDTGDGCVAWSGEIELADALEQHACVEVQPGTYTLTAGVILQPGQVLRGVDAATTILKAAPSWSFHCCDAMVSDSLPAEPEADPFVVSNLTLDGSGVATYNVCCRGYTVEDSILINSRCSAIGAAGRGVVARNNHMLDSAHPTNVPGHGLVNCATGGFGGVDEGAAIYSEATADDLGTLIEGNTIQNSYGPAVDINGAWGGVFRGNIVSGNSDWAAISLYGASHWVIEDNQISHPPNEPPQPYHPFCATGPGGGNSAGIFLCQDTDANNLVTTHNQIANNQTSSFYGILSVGADEVQPYLAPRNNTFIGNDVSGSTIGCADDFSPGQWLDDTNVWMNNNCDGTQNSGPVYF
jgi:parallel beta-helix repeat protein